MGQRAKTDKARGRKQAGPKRPALPDPAQPAKGLQSPDAASEPAPNVLEVPVTARLEGKSREALIGIVATQGVLANAATVQTFSNALVGLGDITEITGELQRSVAAAKRGDLSVADSYLIPQAVALNALFGELMRRAAMSMGEHPDAMERYMRLAFKAQSQCRSTFESLAKIHNPPNVAFVRQANIANGPQQVNNAPCAACTGESDNAQNELLEVQDGEWMDAGKASEAG